MPDGEDGRGRTKRRQRWFRVASLRFEVALQNEANPWLLPICRGAPAGLFRKTYPDEESTRAVDQSAAVRRQ